MEKLCVVLIDPRGTINPIFGETIQRQERYAAELKNLEPNSRYVIVTTSLNKKSSRMDDNDFITLGAPNRISLRYIYRSWRFTRSLQCKRILLTCADPWESFIAVLLINLLSGNKHFIQVQVHADIGDLNWIGLNKINKARSIVARKLLNYSDQIRVMSAMQKANLVKMIPAIKDKVVVSPVPLNFARGCVPRSKRVAKRSRIGFVGRFEPDRGLKEFIELIQVLNSNNQDFELVIAGQGKEKDWFLNNLKAIVGPSRVVFRGFLSGLELSENYSELNLLLSTAPSESYGRTMREAIICGVPVVTFDNSASREIIDLVGNQVVQIIPSRATDAEKIRILKRSLTTKGLSEASKKLLELDEIAARKIAEDWVRYIED